MATIDVKDANGDTQSIEKPLVPGRADANNSRPVVLSDQDYNVLGSIYGAITTVGTPAGENHIGEIGGKTVIFDLTLSLDTSAYTSGDVMADTQQCDGFFRKSNGTGVIQSMTIIDEDDQKQSFDVYFFSANKSLGTENSAPSISDTDARDILGIVSITSGDYKDLGGVSIASVRNIGLPVKAVSGTDDLYIGTIINGAGTYTASGVKIRIGGLLD